METSLFLLLFLIMDTSILAIPSSPQKLEGKDFSFECESAEIHHSMGTMVLLRLHWTEIHQQLNANLLNIIGLKEDIENYLCWFYGMSKQFNH